jgi:hypothetical protein
MKLQRQQMAALVLVAVFLMALRGLGVAANPQTPGQPDQQAQPGSAEPLMLAQAGVIFSRTCATARGTCVLPQPQPIGSQCFCSGLGPGQVVR